MTNYINKKMVLVGILVVAVGLLITWLVVDYWNAGFTAGKTPKLEDVEEVKTVENEFDTYYLYVANEKYQDGSKKIEVKVPKGSDFKVTYRYYMVKEPGLNYWKSYDVEEAFEGGTYVVDLVPGMYTKVGDR